MNTSILPDTSITLLGRLRASPIDQAAWSDFVYRYEPGIYAWCRRWNLQHHDAEEVTQIVLVRLADRLRTFRYDPTKSFRKWLRTVAKRIWVDFLRSLKSTDRGVGGEQILTRLRGIPVPDDFVTCLQDQLDSDLLSRIVDRVRKRVQPTTWQAFCLQVFDGQTGPQTAQKLGLTVSNVYVATHRVLKLLKEEIDHLSNRAASGDS